MRALCILLAALVQADPCPSGFGDYSEAKCYRRLDAASFTDCSGPAARGLAFRSR